MSIVAGVDSSTQSVKIEVRDLDTGEVVARASAPHPAVTPPVCEQDPRSWRAAFESAWRSLGEPDVAAIAIAGQQHGMVALDRSGEPVHPAKLWNDTESDPDVDWLLGRLDRAQWASRVGSVPLAAFTITKLSWLHRSHPDAWRRLAHVLLPHDYLTWALTGTFVTDRGDASGTGYWSPSAERYDDEILALVDDAVDWATVLPRVAAPFEPVGRWGDALVAPGTGDNMAAALGLGLRPGQAAVSVGTSGTVYCVATSPSADETGQVAGFADATGHYLPLVCTSNAAKVLDATARLLGVDHDRFDRLAVAGLEHGGAPTLVPYLDGERTPYRPDATGTWAGIRSDITREQFAASAVLGVVCGLLDGVDALATVASGPELLVLTGGGARSQALRRAFATLAGRPVAVSDTDEAVAAGAAVQAASTIGEEDPVDVQRRWNLGRFTAVEPVESMPDRDTIRARYATARDR
jgi:xylulokinase